MAALFFNDLFVLAHAKKKDVCEEANTREPTSDNIYTL